MKKVEDFFLLFIKESSVEMQKKIVTSCWNVESFILRLCSYVNDEKSNGNNVAPGSI